MKNISNAIIDVKPWLIFFFSKAEIVSLLFISETLRVLYFNLIFIYTFVIRVELAGLGQFRILSVSRITTIHCRHPQQETNISLMISSNIIQPGSRLDEISI